MSERARLLIAADAPMVRGILAHKLRREGHEVVCIRTADELQRALDAAPFDCAICELPLIECCRGRAVHPERELLGGEPDVLGAWGSPRESAGPQRGPDASRAKWCAVLPQTTFGACWLAIVDGRDEPAAMRAMQLGAAGVVRTPFKPTVVAEQVATLLRISAVTA
ncbi:MAG: hypothetical protein JOY80_03795 [Candidatus Dormibacteraeota bacterium]|nr:hypothetical protein [Candidatus Dormibacteraeota bacterium]